jgi:hypothetical protein
MGSGGKGVRVTEIRVRAESGNRNMSNSGKSPKKEMMMDGSGGEGRNSV